MLGILQKLHSPKSQLKIGTAADHSNQNALLWLRVLRMHLLSKEEAKATGDARFTPRAPSYHAHPSLLQIECV